MGPFALRPYARLDQLYAGYKCPLCASTRWSIEAQPIVLLNGHVDGTGTPRDDLPIGTKHFNTVSAICQDCGYVVLHKEEALRD